MLEIIVYIGVFEPILYILKIETKLRLENNTKAVMCYLNPTVSDGLC